MTGIPCDRCLFDGPWPDAGPHYVDGRASSHVKCWGKPSRPAAVKAERPAVEHPASIP